MRKYTPLLVAAALLAAATPAAAAPPPKPDVLDGPCPPHGSRIDDWVYITDPGDPARFYQCGGDGMLITFQCGAGTVFDRRLAFCDFPERARRT
ncbi:chitin binding peritrophin-A domain-containing protein [Actinomadura parmotrematis]|uniref:Chitin binding domain-containing protein n=1 Tax=Actinomadura parmotrematis TaxID=2864039 RepID=A0ABS7FR26_9ACTN|nr:chitin binding peritrophin-A domain-containing protein [Actinomadura parmotrematis]MBW8481992.1 chitin binding domain-containing protein [Actinomadura parmotrematis]